MTAETLPTFGDAVVVKSTVKWAVAAGIGAESTLQQVRAFDTETNTIFVGGDTDGQFVSYDSNDRFNIDRPDPDPEDPGTGDRGCADCAC